MLRDPGSFWHVVAGEKMLDAGQVIREDPFSFTRAGKPWVADQWLAECCMAAVHRVAGWDGLLLLTATLLAGVYAWIAARLLRGGLHILPAILLMAMAMMVGSPQFHVRPLIVTIVLLGVTFGWLVDVEARSRRFRQLWWLVPLFLLWTNMHGGMLGGLGTVAICLGGWCVSTACRFRTGADASSLANQVVASILLLIALAATILVSPYGLAMPQEWLETLAMPLPHFIEEHAPLDLAEPIGWATLALGAVYLVTLIGVFPGTVPIFASAKMGLSPSRQRWPRITWLVPLVWFVLAFFRVRNAPLFGVTAVIALADMLPYSRVGQWLEQRDLLRVARPERAWGVTGTNLVANHALAGRATQFTKRSLIALLLPVVVVAAAALLQIGGVRLPVIGRGWARFDPAECPVELEQTLDKINRSSAKGARIFNDMNFGGFLIYHAPHLRVFIDDRCPLYGTEFLLAYDHARREDPAQIDLWRRQYGFDYALVETGRQFDRYLSGSPGWTQVQSSSAATLYRSRSNDPVPAKPDRVLAPKG